MRFLSSQRVVGFFALACVVMVVILSGNPMFTNAARPPRGIVDPGLALEVARNVHEVDAILSDAPSPDREVMRMKQYLDFGFIVSYAGLYLALAMMFGSRLAMTGAICGVVAAISDVVENLAILRILDVPLRGTTQAMVDAIRWPSLTKWTLAFLATAIFGALFSKSPRWTWKVIGACNLVAAALGFYGLYDNAFLFWAGIPLGLGLIWSVGVFLRFKGARSTRKQAPHVTG